MGSVADVAFFVCPVIALLVLAVAGIFMTGKATPAAPADEVDGRAL